MVLPQGETPREEHIHMAEQNGSKPEEVLDLDAFSPVPTRKLKVGGKLYHVTSFFDIGAEEALKLLRIEEEAAGKSINDQLERLRQQVKILVPDLPEKVLGKFSWRQLVATTREAWLLARPQEAPSSSPETIPGAVLSSPPDGVTVSEPSSPDAPASTASATAA